MRLRGGYGTRSTAQQITSAARNGRTAAPFHRPSPLPALDSEAPGMRVPARREYAAHVFRPQRLRETPAGASSIHTFLDARKRLWKQPNSARTKLGRWDCSGWAVFKT